MWFLDGTVSAFFLVLKLPLISSDLFNLSLFLLSIWYPIYLSLSMIVHLIYLYLSADLFYLCCLSYLLYLSSMRGFFHPSTSMAAKLMFWLTCHNGVKHIVAKCHGCLGWGPWRLILGPCSPKSLAFNPTETRVQSVWYTKLWFVTWKVPSQQKSILSNATDFSSASWQR